MELDAKNRQLLNLIQADFPLERRPFRVLGQRLGLKEEEVLRRVRRLKE
ncbi:MAG: AsnC family transcriptional regulator, partial [Nitrospinota bacterium]